MSLIDVLRRYQSYDPETRRFDATRSDRQYALLVGVDPATLSRIYSGERPVSTRVLRGLTRTFPAASVDIAAALAQPESVEVAS